MISGEQTFGIVANAEKVKAFAKTMIKSNQSLESWNSENSETISKGLLSNRKKVPICIWGPHGIGKTEMLKSVANELTIDEERSDDERWLFTSIAPAQFEEMGDLLGMPSIDPGVLDDPSDDMTILVPPEWTPYKVEQKRFEKTGKHGPGIFLIDDANRADIRIISGLMQLLQDYELASWPMPEGWHIVLTANPPGGEYIVKEMDDAMMTRMLHIEMRYDEKVWARWAEGQQIDPRGISFVLGYPELMTGKRTTPRTLVQFFNAIEGIDDLKNRENADLVTTIGRACLDPETVAEFLQFVRNSWSKIVQPNEILDSKNFKDIETRMSSLVTPSDGKSVKRVDIANIITQRLINKLYVMEDTFSKKQKENVVQYLKLDAIPLDLRVAAGKDLNTFAMKVSKQKDASAVMKKNGKMMISIFSDPTLAKDILGKMR